MLHIQDGFPLACNLRFSYWILIKDKESPASPCIRRQNFTSPTRVIMLKSQMQCIYRYVQHSHLLKMSTWQTSCSVLCTNRSSSVSTRLWHIIPRITDSSWPVGSFIVCFLSSSQLIPDVRNTLLYCKSQKNRWVEEDTCWMAGHKTSPWQIDMHSIKLLSFALQQLPKQSFQKTVFFGTGSDYQKRITQGSLVFWCLLFGAI